MLLGLAMMLAGCETVRTVYVDRVEYVCPSVAPSLFRCTAEPAPLAPGARQRDLPPYVLDLATAGRDCRRKLGTVAKRLEAQP